MKIETQPLEDHQVKLIVEVDSEPFEQAKRRAARELSRRTKIPGFRPGKAPYNVVQRLMGEEVIFTEGLELLLKDLYPKIIEEADIKPHGPGRFENIASKDPLTLEFIVPLVAEVELGDYRSIRFLYELKEVTEQDVDEVLENLRQRQALEEPANRPAEEGDHVFFQLSGKRLNVEKNQNSTLIQEGPESVIIVAEEDDSRDEWPYSGFSREIIGMKPGDEKTVTRNFPDDFPFESLRGITAEFKVKVDEVKSRNLPDLNDEFAQSIGDYESLEGLRADIRVNLEQQNRETYDEEYDEKIISELVSQANIKYSPQMLEEEIDNVIHQLERRLKSQNLDLETYLKAQNIDAQGLRDEVSPVAESRLRRSLVLLKVADAEGVEIPPEELEAETQQTLEAMSRFMSKSELHKIPSRELIPNLVSNIFVEMKVRRTLERLRAIAKDELELVSNPSPEESPEEEEA